MASSVHLSFFLRKEINVYLVHCVAKQLIFANLYHVTRSTGNDGGDYNRSTRVILKQLIHLHFSSVDGGMDGRFTELYVCSVVSRVFLFDLMSEMLYLNWILFVATLEN